MKIVKFLDGTPMRDEAGELVYFEPRYSAAKIGIDYYGRYTYVEGYVGPRRWWSGLMVARAVAKAHGGASGYEIHVVQEGADWHFDAQSDGCPDGCLCIQDPEPQSPASIDAALQEARELGHQWIQLGARKVNRR